MAGEDDDAVPGLALQLLGRFQVRRDGEEVPPAAFGGRKVRTLLRVLAVRRPDLVPHEVLAEALWPDQQPADPAANLTVLVTRARRALAVPEAVVTGPGGYALGPCTVDVAEFLVLAQQARQALREGRPADADRDCAAALALWGEPLAEDTYAEWARSPRERLLRARVDVLETAARCCARGGGRGDGGRVRGRRGRGRPAARVRGGGTSRRRWRRRVTGPGRWPRWTACGPGCATSWASTRRRSRRSCGRRCSGTRCPEATAVRRRAAGSVRRSREAAPGRTFGGLAFVGRDAELARLRAAIDAREVVALGGVAGAGKSRLVAEATRDVALPVLTCRAFLPERGEAWGLARSVLREALALDAHLADRLAPRVRAALAVLLPEIDGIEVPLDGEARRALVLAGGVELLAAAVRDGAVLVVDDLQWADPSSRTFLASALARLPRLAAVLAFRPDEPALDLPADDVRSTDPAPSTTSALAAVRATRGVVDVTLGALPDDGLDALVGDPRLAAALRTETDRTPFAVAEVLRELAVRGVAVAGPDGRWRPRDAERRRARRRGGPAGTAAGRAAARRARDRCARAGAGARRAARPGDHRPDRGDGRGPRPARALDALSGLATAGLLRLGEQGWATAHDLVGETVTAALAPGERGRLHGLLAGGVGGRRTPTRPRSPGTTATPATARPPPRPSSGPRAGRWTRTPPGRPPRTPRPGWRWRRTVRACSTPAPRPGRRTGTSPAPSPTCSRAGRRAGPGPLPAAVPRRRC